MNLGFLTVLHENNGYIGGYLVTNQWGRPLEFRLSSAVQPNRVQQIIYGDTLEPYVCADLIAKTLVEKTPTPVQCIWTDFAPVLELRRSLELPVALWSDSPVNRALAQRTHAVCHASFPDDAPLVHDLVDRLDGTVTLSEPFARIRAAISEARKVGAASRA
jgi:hypothetical protein